MAGRRKLVLEDVTVLVPTLGRAMLEGCLSRIAHGTLQPRELVLVDQGVNPTVSDYVKRLESLGLRTKYIKMLGKGIAIAMNRGLEEVETKIVAVTHDDCHVAEDWLERMTTRVRQDPHAIVTGRVEPGHSEGACDGIVLSVNTSMTPVTYTRPLLMRDVLYPNNMGFTISIVNKVGLFDESPFFAAAAEDNDWQYRALRAGVPIVYAPDVVVHHLDWRDRAKREATYRIYFRSQGALYGKYLRRGDLFMALRAAIDLARGPRRWVFGLLRGDHEMSAGGRAKATQLLPGIIEGLRGKPS